MINHDWHTPYSFNTMWTNGKIQLYPMMRIALFLGIGIIAGKACLSLVPPEAWLAATVALLSATWLARRHSIMQTLLVFCACATTSAYFTARELSFIYRQLPTSPVTIQGVITSPIARHGKVLRCDLLVAYPHHPLKIKTSILYDERSALLHTGDGIRATTLLSAPVNFPTATFDYRRYLHLHGYAATTFIRSPQWQPARVSMRHLSFTHRLRIKALKWRDRLLSSYRASGISGNAYSLLAAMTLGDKTTLSEDTKEDFSISGASHVLALSGLHLSIIYMMLTLLLGHRRFMVFSQMAIVLCIWVFTFMVGMPLSAVRSATMLSIYAFVALLNRNNVPLNTLGLAVAAILLFNPLALYDIGFQLSFAAVLSILVVGAWCKSSLPSSLTQMPVAGKIIGLIIISIAAQMGTAPLVIHYFGRFSCYFLLTNLVVIPLVTVILYVAAFCLLFSFLPAVQQALSPLLLHLTNALSASVSFIASLPGSSIDNIHINAWQTAILYLIIIMVVLLIRKLRLLL